MYEHERSLVKRLEGKPFALIGVNSDKDRQKLKEVLVKERITWRSFWNGGSTGGPISRQWQVTSWPSIWVIDANGVIRYRDVRGPEMDRAVNALLKEMGVAVSELPAPGGEHRAILVDHPIGDLMHRPAARSRRRARYSS